MKMLQIGLGSMGKRRIRNLLALGEHDIIGFDLREDRRKETEMKYQIKTTDNLTEALLKERQGIIISTPPDHHLEYIKLALKNKKPAFVEASVVKKGLVLAAAAAKKNKILIAPSCTLRFHPSIKNIKDIVSGGKYGKICNFVYSMGQYLPDWHPWEDIKDFYVSKKETSAPREMVPFELTWIVDVMGHPKEVFAFYGKTYDMGVDIDDTYNVNLRFKNCLGILTVDVVARFGTRSLILNLEKAQIRWNWEERMVKLYEINNKKWVTYADPNGRAEPLYNENIVENMYIEELNCFIGALKGRNTFPNTLDDDIKVLDILEAAEKTNRGVILK